MTQRLVLFLLSSLFLLITPIQAVQSGVIGYVNLQQVIDKSESGQKARRTLEEKFEDRQQELAREQQVIRQSQQTLDKDKVLMSQKELDKKTTGIQKRIKAFREQLARFQREMSQEENKLANRILKPVPEIIAAVARDKKVSAIFERRQSGLLHIDEGLDLTAEVIKRLDAKHKKK